MPGSVGAMLLGTALGALPGMSFAQDLSLDGRSNTTIRINGLVTDVRTQTVSKGSGINSFSKLDVSRGRTVNLHVPDNATRTINLVRDKRSDIAGTLNSIKNGSIGGGILIANPNGLVVTSSGRVNAGNFSVSTPTRGFVDNFFHADGTPKDSATQALLDGTAPQNPDADINIHGRINAGENVRLQAGRDINITGRIDVGARAAFVSQFANIGEVNIRAGRDIAVEGTITARKAATDDGGTINVRGARDARISGVLDASGSADGHGGRVEVIVDRDALLEDSGRILAEAPGAGDGGFVELSGHKTVTMIGEISARSTSGRKGAVLIDPETFEILENEFTQGQDFTVIASRRIFVGDGVIVSTKEADPFGNAFYAGGEAGDLTFRAPEIELGAGAQLISVGGAANPAAGLPFGTRFDGGTITLEAIAEDTLTSAGIAQAESRIILGNDSRIFGKDVNITAKATSVLDVDSITDAPSFSEGGYPQTLTEAVNRAAAIAVDELAEAFDITLVPARLSAIAKIDSSASQISAQGGDLTIDALAETRVDMAPDSDAFALLGVSTNTDASIVLNGGVRTFQGQESGLQQQLYAAPDFERDLATGAFTEIGGGDINITAKTIEDQKIRAVAGDDGAFAGVAVALSHRQQNASVGFDRGAVNNQTQSPVRLDGKVAVRALSEQSFDLEADASAASGVGVAAVGTLGEGQTVIAGGLNLPVDTRNYTFEAETTVGIFRTVAKSGNGGDGDQLSDGTARDNLDAASGQMGDELAASDDGTDGESPTAGAAAFASSLVFSQYNQDTVATTGSFTDVGTAVANDLAKIDMYNGFSDETPGQFTISALTDIQDVEIVTEAISEGGGNVLMSGSYTDWDIGTDATLSDITIENYDQNQVNVTAETRLPQTGASDTVDAELAGTDLSTHEANRGTIAARAGGTTGLGLTVTGAVARITTDTNARATRLGRLSGMEDFDYPYDGGYGDSASGYDDGTGGPDIPTGPSLYGAYRDDQRSPGVQLGGKLSLSALTAGRLNVTANDPVWSPGLADPQNGQSAIGAGAAIGLFDFTTIAELSDYTEASTTGPRGRLSALDVKAENAAKTVVAAGAGTPGTEGNWSVNGAFAYTDLTTQTLAGINAGIDIEVIAPEAGSLSTFDGATNVAATDSSQSLVLAGVAADGSAVSVGVSAAITKQNRDTRAVLGESFDIDYLPFERDPQDPNFNKPALYFSSNKVTQYFDDLSVVASNSADVTTLAAAGLADQNAQPQETPTRVGKTELDEEVTEEKTVETGDARNPTEGAKAGFDLSGAVAINLGTVETRAYVGTLGAVIGDQVQISALDFSDTTAKAGGAVPSAAGLGIGGAFAMDSTDRATETLVRGGGIAAFDYMTIGAQSGGRTAVEATGSAGAAKGGASIAGSFALSNGSDDALVELGSTSLVADGPLIVTALVSSRQTIKAGSAVTAPPKGEDGGSFGLGAAAAIDVSDSTAEVRAVAFAQDDSGFGEQPTQGVIVASRNGSAQLTAIQDKTREIEASAAGVLEGVGITGSAAILGGTVRSRVVLRDLSGLGMTVLGGTSLDLSAETKGTASAIAGSTAEGRVAVGLAFALAQEGRSAFVQVENANIQGLEEISNSGVAGIQVGALGHLGLAAETSTDILVRAIAGAKTPEAEASEDEAVDGADDTAVDGADGEGDGNDAKGFAGNGSVALNRANTAAAVNSQSSLGTQGFAANAVVVSAFERARLTAEGGGVSTAGDGIGAGFGLGLLSGQTLAEITLADTNVTGSGRLELNALSDGRGTAKAVNGAIDSALNIGVNVAGGSIDAITQVYIAGRAGAPTTFDMGSVDIDARDTAEFTAEADAVNPVAGDTSTIAVGLSGFKGSRRSDISFDQTTLTAGGIISATAKSEAAFIATSEQAEGLRIDLSQVSDQTDDEGEVTSSGGFNLEIAAALANLNASAHISVQDATLTRGVAVSGARSVALEAEARLNSDIAGAAATDADVDLTRATVIGRSVSVRAIANSNVEVDGTRETNKSAKDRADKDKADALAASISDAAESEEEQDSFAISAAFVPESASADAAISIDDSSVFAENSASIRSGAVTNITLGAGAAPIAVALALTETNAGLTVKNSDVISGGALILSATVDETQDLTAQAAADSDLPVDVAAVISVRKANAQVLIDNDTAHKVQGAATLSVDALVNRNLRYLTRSWSNEDDVVSVAGMVSYGEGYAGIGFGGTVEAGTLDTNARVTNAMNIRTIATGGDAVKDGPGGTDDAGASEGMDLTLRGAADALAEKTVDDGEAETDTSSAAQVGLGVTVMLQNDTAETVFGGDITDLSDNTVALNDASVRAILTDIDSVVSHADTRLRTGALIEAKDAPGVAVTAAVTYAGLSSTTRIQMRDGSSLFGTADFNAETRLGADGVDLNDAIAEYAEDDARDLETGAEVLDDGRWMVAQSSGAIGADVGVGVDAGILNLNIDNDVRIDGTLTRPVSADAMIVAQTTGHGSLRVGDMGDDAQFGDNLESLKSNANAETAGIGVSAGILLVDERNAVTVGQTATVDDFAVDPATSTTFRAGSDADYVNVALAKSEGGKVGVGAAIAVTISDRQTLATLHPDARLNDSIVLRAQDNASHLTAGLTDINGGSVGVGTGVALAFLDSQSSAGIGSRAADGTLNLLGDTVPQGGAYSLTLDASTGGDVLTVAQPGTRSGPSIADMTENFDFDSFGGRDVGDDAKGAMTGTVEAGEEGVAEYGLGISAGFAFTYGTVTTEARAADIDDGTALKALTLKAADSVSVMTVADATSEGIYTNSVAGAAAIDLLDTNLRAGVDGLTMQGGDAASELTVDARSDGLRKTVAQTASDLGFGEFSVLASAALQLGDETVTAGVNDIRTDARLEDLSITAAAGRRLFTSAGASNFSLGQSIGLGASLDLSDRGSSATLSTVPNSTLSVNRLTVTADLDDARTVAAKTNGISNENVISGAVTLLAGDAAAQVVLDDVALNIAGPSRIGSTASGDIMVESAVRGASLSNNIGVLSGVSSHDRRLDVTVSDSVITASDALVIAASDTGSSTTQLSHYGAAANAEVSVQSVVMVDDSRAVVSVADTDLNATSEGSIAVQAMSDRSRKASFTLLSGGTGVGVGVGSVVLLNDSDVSATLTDVDLQGGGAVRVLAREAGDVTLENLIAAVSTGTTVDAAFTNFVDHGSVTAGAYGIGRGGGDSNGILEVLAEDGTDELSRKIKLETSRVGASGNFNIGAAFQRIVNRRDVTATVTDSAGRATDLSRGDVAVRATTHTDLDIFAREIGAAASGSIGVVYRQITNDRDVVALAGGLLQTGDLTIAATRNDRMVPVTIGGQIGQSMTFGAKVNLFEHSGATLTEGQLRQGSRIGGDLTAQAVDRSELTAVSLGAAASNGIAGSFEMILGIMGSGVDTDVDRPALAAAEDVPEADRMAAQRLQMRNVATEQTELALTSADITDVAGLPVVEAALGASIVRAAISGQEGTMPGLQVDGDVTILADDDTKALAVNGQAGVSASTAVVPVITYLSRETATEAVLDLSLTPQMTVGGKVDLDARSDRNTTAFGIGVAVSGGSGGAGAFSMTNDARSLRSQINGGALTAAGDISLDSSSSGDVSAVALIGTTSAGATGGVGVSWALNNRDTVTDILGTTLTSTGGSVRSDAVNGSSLLALSTAASVSGSTGVSVGWALGSSNADTLARVRGSTINAAGDIAVEANNFDRVDGSGGTVAIVTPIAVAASTAVTAGVANVVRDGRTLAQISQSNTQAGDDLIIEAESGSGMTAVGVGAAVSGSTSVAGSLSVAVRQDETSALLTGGTHTAQDSVLVRAETITQNASGAGDSDIGDLPDNINLANTQVDISVGGSVGVGVSVATPVTRGETVARIAGGAQVRALAKDDLPGDLGYSSRITLGNAQTVRGVAVSATSLVNFDSFVLTAGVAGSVGVAAKLSVLSARDSVIAEIGAADDPVQTRVTSGKDIDLIAEGKLSIGSTSIVAGVGGSTAGVGAAVDTILVDRKIHARAIGSLIDAADRVNLSAKADDTLTTVTVAGGAGLYAGVGAGVLVMSSTSDVWAHTDGAFVLGRDATLAAQADRKTFATTMGLGLGGFGAGTGSVVVLNSADTVRATIADNEADDPAAVFAVRDLNVSADLDHDLQVAAGSGGGALGTLNGTVAVLNADATVEAVIGERTIIGGWQNGPSARNVSVTASQRLQSNRGDMVEAGKLALGGVALGGTVAVLSSGAQTVAQVGRDAQLNLTGDLTVEAKTDRTLDAAATSLSFGFGTIDAIVSVVLVGESADDIRTGAAARAVLQNLGTENAIAVRDSDGNAQELLADYRFEDDEANADRQAAAQKAAAQFTANGAASDQTLAEVQDGVRVRTAGDITVAADDLTDANARAGAVSGSGNFGFTAGYARSRVTTSTQAVVRDGAHLQTGGAVTVSAATGAFDKAAGTRAKADAGAVGAGITLNTAFARAENNRVTEAVVESGAQIGNQIAGLVADAAKVEVFANNPVTATVDGLAASGGAAVNGLDADATDKSVWRASLGGANSDIFASDVTVAARHGGDLLAKADGLSIALGAAGGLIFANAQEDLTLVANVGSGVTALDDLKVSAEVSRDVESEADGASVGLVAGGGVFAETIADRTVRAEVATDITGAARVDVAAVAGTTPDRNRITAVANGTTAGVLAGTGTTSVVTLSGEVEAVFSATEIDGNDLITVEATSAHEMISDADSFGAGIAAGGVALASGTNTMTTRARFSGWGQADTVRLMSSSDDRSFAGVIGAGGGVIGVSATKADLSHDTQTVTQIDTQGQMLMVDRFDARRTADVSFSALADTLNVTAIGVSAARAEANVTQSGGIAVSNASLVARDVGLRSVGAIRKDRRGAAVDVEGGSGGLVDVSGVRAKDTLGNLNGITIGNTASVMARGRNAQVSATAVSDTRSDIAARLTVGGGVAVPDARAETNITQTATINVGGLVQSDGEIQMSTRADVSAAATSDVDAIGLGTRIRADAKASYDGDGGITVGGTVESFEGDVRLSAGQADGQTSQMDVSTRATYFSGSFVPVDRTPVSYATAALDTDITVLNGGSVSAGRNLLLTAAAPEVDVTATGRGKNTYTATAEEVANFFIGVWNDVTGDDVVEVNLDIDPDARRSVTLNSGVKVDGLIASGMAGAVFIRVDGQGRFVNAAGQVLSADAALRLPARIVSGTVAQIAAPLIADLEAQRDAFRAEGAGALADLVQLEIDQTLAELDAIAARNQGVVRILTLDDITLDGGDIVIDGDYLIGTGTVSAASNVGLDLTVDAAGMVVVLNNITLPDDPGLIRLGGVPARNVNTVRFINDNLLFERRAQLSRGGFGGTFTPAWQPDDALTLTIQNARSVRAEVSATAVDDIFATGDITNRNGSLTLSSAQGDVFVSGRNEVDTSNVSALQGLVLIGFQPGVLGTSGDYRAKVAEALQNVEQSTSGGNIPFTPSVPPQSRGAGMFGANIAIYGEAVDINGEIVGGKETYVVDIPETVDAMLDDLRLQTPQGGRVVIYNPVSDTLGPVNNPYGITGDAVVIYDIDQEHLEIAPIVATGGQIRIAAQDIVSTGNGSITVLDGYSQIDIDSKSSRTVRLSGMDTGGAEGVRGELQIIDVGLVVDPQAVDTLDKYLVTTYRGVDLPSPQGGTYRGWQKLVNGSVVTTQPPQLGQRETSYEIRTTSGRDPYLSFDVESRFQIDNGVRILEENGRTLGTQSIRRDIAGSAAPWFYTKGPTTTEQVDGVTYETQTTTHYLRAAEDVAINFIGHFEGDIDVRTRGGIEIAGLIRNEEGDLTLSAGPRESFFSDGNVTGLNDLPERFRPLTRTITGVDPTALVRGETVRLVSRQIGLGPKVETGVSALGGDPLAIAMASGGTLRVEAPGGDVALRVAEGSVNIATLQGRDVFLRADGLINDAAGGIVTASGDVTLVSDNAGVKSSLRGVGGDLNVSAAGDIELGHFTSGNNPLRIGTIATSNGSIDLRTNTNLVDANDQSTRDVITEEALLADFWVNAGYLDATNGPQDSRDGRIDRLIAAETAQRQATFDFFLSVTGTLNAAYRPDLIVDLSAAEAAQFADPDAERARRTRMYHAGAQLTGLGNVSDPDAQAALVGAGQSIVLTETAPLDAANGGFADSFSRSAYIAVRKSQFTETPDATTVAEITNAHSFDFTDLDLGLRRGLIKQVTDTVVDIEAPNFKATGDVLLRASNIGQDRRLATLVAFDNPDVNASVEGTTYIVGAQAPDADGVIRQQIPRAFLVLLAQAESEDLQVGRRPDPASAGDLINSVTVFGVEDIDIEAPGEINVLATEADTGRAFIGSETSLDVRSAVAADRLRIKVGGGLTGQENPLRTQAFAREMILEAATGAIGSTDSPFRIGRKGANGAESGDLTVTARAQGDIYLTRGFGSAGADFGVDLREVFTEGAFILSNTYGSINSEAGGGVVSAGSVRLDAARSIGGRGSVQLAFSDPDAETVLTAIDEVDVTSRKLGADDGISIPSTGSIRLGSAQGSDVTITAEQDIILVGESGLRTIPDFGTGTYIKRPAISASTKGLGDVVLRAAGSILDASLDEPDGTPLQNRVADIFGGDLRILDTGQFGTLDNPIETDVLSVSGAALNGAYLRDRRDLAYRGIFSPNGDQVIEAERSIQIGDVDGGLKTLGQDTPSVAPITLRGQNVTLKSLTVQAFDDVTFSGGSLTIDGQSVVDLFDGAHIKTTGASDLTITGQFIRSNGVTGASAGGDLTIDAKRDLSIGNLRGRNVTVTAFDSETRINQFTDDPFTYTFAVPATVGNVTATQDVSIRSTDTTVIGAVNAGGIAKVDASYALGPVAQVTMGTVTARTEADLILDMPVGDTLVINAPVLTGRISGFDSTLALRDPIVLLDGLDFDAGGSSAIDAAGRKLAIGNIELRDAVVTAQSVDVRGTIGGGVFAGATFDILDKVEIADDAGFDYLGDLTINVGKSQPDAPLGNPDADLEMSSGGLIRARTVTLDVADVARITGLEASTNIAGVVGLDLKAASFEDAGNKRVDLTANENGVVTNLRGDLNLKPGEALTTQINTLAAAVANGDLNISEADTLIVTDLRAARGKIDIVVGRDLLLDHTDPASNILSAGLGNAESAVVLTAGRSLFTAGSPDISAEGVFLTALNGSVGSEASPFKMTSGQIDALSATAAGGVTLEIDAFVQDGVLFAAHDGRLFVANGGRPFNIQAYVSGLPGETLDGIAAANRLRSGRYSTLPKVTDPVQSDLYPTRIVSQTATDLGQDETKDPSEAKLRNEIQDRGEPRDLRTTLEEQARAVFEDFATPRPDSMEDENRGNVQTEQFQRLYGAGGAGFDGFTEQERNDQKQQKDQDEGFVRYGGSDSKVRISQSFGANILRFLGFNTQ